MSSSDFVAEVTCLSPTATEADLLNFFSLCGEIDAVEIVRAGDYASTAYVTFRNSYSLDTAILLSGATIGDRPVCITRWGHTDNENDIWNYSYWGTEDESSTSRSQSYRSTPSAGEAVSFAQDVVKTMISQGYILGKDALAKARAFDESHHVSAAAAAKVAEMSDRIGLTDKIFAGMEVARSLDQKYLISDATKTAVSLAGRSAASAASAVVNSGYFSKGALWLSGALTKAAEAAAELGARGANK